jgi:outer membrane protein OmpA-like peptidoglycan-associated protein
VPAVVTASFTLPGDALFQFGKSGKTDILPGGHEKLAALAGTLKIFSKIQMVKVVGHTDRLGSDALNDRLSAERAATVLAQLEALGVKAVAASAQGVGKREPVTRTCGNKLARPALIACLQPDRRVTIEVSGLK